MMRLFVCIFTGVLVIGCNKRPEIYSHKLSIEYSFQPLGRVVLQYTDSMFVGRLASFAVFKDGRLSIGDNLDSKVKIFSPDGKFIKSISKKGSGPGETRTLLWHCIDDSGRVWINDYALRSVSVYDTSGSFQARWLPLEGCENCHLRGTIRVVNNKIYLSMIRAAANPAKARDIFSLVSAFDFQHNLIAEYGAYDQSVEDYSLEPHYVFDVDSSSNFYLAHDNSNIIWKSSADGSTIKGFYYPAHEFRPIKGPPPRSGPRRMWAEWYASATAVGAMEIVGKYLFISFVNRDLEYFTNYDNRYRYEYLQVFDLDGNCLIDFLKAPGQFLCSDHAGVLYFLEEEEPGRMVISKYKFVINREEK